MQTVVDEIFIDDLQLKNKNKLAIRGLLSQDN